MICMTMPEYQLQQEDTYTRNIHTFKQWRLHGMTPGMYVVAYKDKGKNFSYSLMFHSDTNWDQFTGTSTTWPHTTAIAIQVVQEMVIPTHLQL